MAEFNYTIENYSIIKALLWGNCKEHWDLSITGDLNGRKVHRFIAIVEAIPILGQIASLFELAIVKLFETHPVEAEPEVEAETVSVIVEPTSQEIQSMLSALNDTNFDQILSLIKPSIMNMDIYVMEGENREKNYSLSTEEQNDKPIFEGATWDLDEIYEYRHTTTLANIFLTNELNFDHDQIMQLLRKLISLNADFSKCDYTNYRGMKWYRAINNTPLQSLIALGASDPENFDRDFNHFDDAIRELIKFIIKQPYASDVFNHVDNVGQMSPIVFLIRQGKEKLAELIIDSGLAEIGCKELLIAAESFGTNGKDSLDCLPKILRVLKQKNLTITDDSAKQAFESLLKASPYKKHDPENLHVRIGNAYDENFPNLLDCSYFTFLRGQKFNPKDKNEIVARALKHQFRNFDSGFSDEYRSDEISFLGNKYDYLRAHKSLERQIDNLINQINSLIETNDIIPK